MSIERNNEGLISTLICKNRLVINELLNFIVYSVEQRQRFGKSVIGISGAGCLGKSTLAQALACCLKYEYHMTVAVIDLDGFLIEKAIREAGPVSISGYHPKGYELQHAKVLLKNLIERDLPIRVKRYDKVSSQRLISYIVEPARIIIIEGACAFFDKLRNFSDIKIFVEASKDVQFKNRQEREIFEMGRTLEQIIAKFEKLYPDYLKYIKPTKSLADVVLRVDTQYYFYIEKIGQEWKNKEKKYYREESKGQSYIF